MKHHLPKLALNLMLLTTTSVALADTTIIHAGELLAVPGKAAKSGQTIVIDGGATLPVFIS